MEQEPDSVLDYGTGDGKLAERLVRDGATVTAYDPDSTVIERCQSYGSSVESMEIEAAAGKSVGKL